MTKQSEEATREQIERRTDELARGYAETHAPKIKAEMEELSLRLSKAPTNSTAADTR